MKSLVLFSGGLDSCVLAAYAKERGAVLALSFDYGQRHKQELKAAARIATALTIEHIIVPIAISGPSALVDKTRPLSHDRTLEEMASGGLPATYVHARNTLFLAHAMSIAEARGIEMIFFGANRYDYACYPDCRPAYFDAFNALLKIAIVGAPLTIVTPFVQWGKKEIIEEGLRLKAPLDLSFSCYDPQEEHPCGHCDACILRKKGFDDVGLVS